MSEPKKKRPDDPTIWSVDDALWERLAPLLVVEKVRSPADPGRVTDRS
jgi:hypothetical protein